MPRLVRPLLGILLSSFGAGAHADLLVTPADLQFPLGYLGVPSAPHYVTLSNEGGTSLTIVELPSAPAGAFERAGGTCGDAPLTLVAQDSCTLGFTFEPMIVGPTSAIFRITADDGSFVNFVLRGQGEVGGLRTQPGQLMFSTLRVGATDGPRHLTLSNTGPTTLSVTGITPASGVYARAGGSCGELPFTLASQASCTLGYTFTPNAVGMFYQTLTATPDAGAAIDFGLAGEGAIGRLQVHPGSLHFMQPVRIGDVSEEQQVHLSNIGRAELTVTSIQPFPPRADPPFVQTGGSCPPPPFDLPSSGACSVAFVFAPAEVGELEMTVDFWNSVASPESVRFAGVGLPGYDIFADGFDED